jgi:two-component system response regulator BaeR
VILVVEDEAKIARVLTESRTAEGFAVAHLSDGREVVPWVRANDPSLVLLDLRLPGLDGLEVCRALRRFSTVPIIMVTALVEEVDRLMGLDVGADDDVCKPFMPREVVARVKAVLRRPRLMGLAGDRLRVGAFELDEARRRISLSGQPLELTGSEYKLLRKLLRAPGRVFSRPQLLAELHGGDDDTYDRAIDTHVKNLRRRLGPAAGLLRSVYGVGYQLDLP